MHAARFVNTTVDFDHLGPKEMGGASLVILISLASFLLTIFWVVGHKVKNGSCGMGTNPSLVTEPDKPGNHPDMGADMVSVSISQESGSEL